MRVSERGTLMHRVLLIGEVQEPGPSDSVPDHSKGPSGALRVGHRTSRPITVHLILYRQDTNIFNLMGNIGGRDWGKEGVGRLRHSWKPTGGVRHKRQRGGYGQRRHGWITVERGG